MGAGVWVSAHFRFATQRHAATGGWCHAATVGDALHLLCHDSGTDIEGIRNKPANLSRPANLPEPCNNFIRAFR